MTIIVQVLGRSKHILIYGFSMAVLVFLLKWFQWEYLISDYSIDIYIGLISLFFTILGIWIAIQVVKLRTKTIVVEKEVYLPPQENFTINQAELEKLDLTAREYEVLQLLTQGYSNAEIADELFLSISTVKTHVSNVLSKMDVRSRAQAIEKAKRLRITP